MMSQVDLKSVNKYIAVSILDWGLKKGENIEELICCKPGSFPF